MNNLLAFVNTVVYTYTVVETRRMRSVKHVAEMRKAIKNALFKSGNLWESGKPIKRRRVAVNES